MEDPVKFGDFTVNSGRIIRLFDGCTFGEPFTAFCGRPEVAADVISARFVRPIVPDRCVKFGDHSLNRFREIRPETIGGGIFDSFLSRQLLSGSI